MGKSLGSFYTLLISVALFYLVSVFYLSQSFLSLYVLGHSSLVSFRNEMAC